jgi:hypothetical protein
MSRRSARARRQDPTTEAEYYLQLPVVVLTKHFRSIDDVQPILRWVRLLNEHGWLIDRWTAARELKSTGLPIIRLRRGRRREALYLSIGDHLVVREGALVRLDDTTFAKSHRPLPTPKPAAAERVPPVADISPRIPRSLTTERCG